MVSIIVPVFNRLDCTRQCTDAILAHTQDIPYEIILVDNASTDGTSTHLATLSDPARVITNTVNRGFACACNQGAAAARGDVLVFLNNDTQVLPHWLSPLIETLADETVGMVGNRLVYPDGRIQHAGVIFVLWAEQSRFFFDHVFRGFNGQDPRVCLANEFQMVTGACMAMRQRDFVDLKGFDERYWNGLEDIDLCARVGVSGKKIVYQPASCVIHAESQSGPERHAKLAQNNELLGQTWGGKLCPDFVIKGQEVCLGSALKIKAYRGNHTEQTLAEMLTFIHNKYLRSQ